MNDFLGFLGKVGEIAGGVMNVAILAEDVSRENEERRAQGPVVTAEIYDTARRADDYIQKWILANGSTITLLRYPDNSLKLSVKHAGRDGIAMGDLLEPQANEELTRRAIEDYKLKYPHVIANHDDVDLQDPLVPINRWNLSHGQVLFGQKHMGPGELSLVVKNGELLYRFYSEKSRTISFVNALTNTQIPIDGGHQPWSIHNEVEDRRDPSGYKLSDFLNPAYQLEDDRKTPQQKFLEDYKFYTLHSVTVEREPDYTYEAEAGLRGKFRPLFLRAVYFSPVQYPSKVGGAKFVDRTKGSATLLSYHPEKNFAHSEILFEQITRHGHLFKIVHITGGSVQGRVCQKQAYPEIMDYKNFEDIKWFSKSETWICSAKKIRQLLSNIYGKRGTPVPFHFAGNVSIITKIAVGHSAHSCITWSREQLEFLGIKLGDSITDLLYTHPGQYSK